MSHNEGLSWLVRGKKQKQDSDLQFSIPHTYEAMEIGKIILWNEAEIPSN
jgi:hypothetical protein